MLRWFLFGFHDALVVKQARFVEEDPVFVIVEPHRVRIAADDADFAAIRGTVRVAEELEDDNAVLAAFEAWDGFVSDRVDFGLAFVVCDGKASVGLDTREALLGLVEDVPCLLDGDVERFVSDDVPTTEEVMVLGTDTLHLALHDPQCVRVVVDVLDDWGLILDGDPSAGKESSHRGDRVWNPLKDSLVIGDVVEIVIFLEELVGVLEVDHHVESDFWVGLVEAVKHRKEGFVETERVERHLFGADADGLDTRFSERGEPCADLGVVEDHWVTTGEQDLAEFFAAADWVASAVVRDFLIEGADVAGDFWDLREPLLGNGAVGAFDFLARDEFFAVAESAVRRAGRDDIHQAHLVLVQETFDRCVVHLIAGVFGTREVQGLVWTRFDEPLDGLALHREFSEVACDLDGHAFFNIPIAAFESAELDEFFGAVEAIEVVRSAAVEEGLEPVQDLTLVLHILDGLEKCLFFVCWDIFLRLDHELDSIS